MNTTEEKARAIDIVKQMIVDGQVSQEVAEKYFPELNESEDEKIRKEIISALKYANHKGVYNKHLAWLEKQEEFVSADFDDVWEWADCDELTAPLEKYSKDAIKEMCHAWYDKWIELERKNLLEKQGKEEINDDDKAILENWEFIVKENREKWQLSDWFVEATYLLIQKVKHANTGMQGEQKPADKVWPKFKVGDWITNSIETVQITGYDIDYGYQVDYKGNLQHRDTDIIEKEYHLWTIQDAKDGDILQLGGVTAIFREYVGKYIGHEHCKCYCSVCNGDFEIPIEDGEDNIYGYATPATKEQRDLLFAKMHEAGYEWDAEKKELKLLITNGGDFCESENCEQEPACGEDETSIAVKNPDAYKIGFADGEAHEKEEIQPVWSEEDEAHIYTISNVLEDRKNQQTEIGIKILDKEINWLKSLKQRIG